MFKRVKSLLVAGLLVLGSTGFVFADDVCLFGSVGAHEGVNHYIEEADMIDKEQFEAVIAEVEEKENDGYIVDEIDKGEYEAAYAIYGDKDYDNEIDEDEVVVENVYINFANGVMEEKGWLPELAPGTGDTLVAGGVVVVALAAGGLLVVNRKNKKDEE